VKLTTAALVTSAMFMLFLNVVASGQMSVLNTTMSDYVFVSDIGWMFGASLLCMCVAGLGVTFGLSGRGLLHGVLPRLALGLAVVGLVLAAVFRTDLGESLSLSAQIHRYAAGVVFFCVPIAALAVVRRVARPKPLYASVIVTVVVLTLFMTSHFDVMPVALQELNGLFQRLLFVAELVLLAQLAASRSVGQEVARLAVEHLAELRQRGEADRPCAAVLEHRDVRRRDADQLGKLGHGHAAVREHLVEVDLDVVRFVRRHQMVPSRS
jgi:hypothetical protein